MGQGCRGQGETSRPDRVADTGGEMARGIPTRPARLTLASAATAQAVTPAVATNRKTTNATRRNLYIGLVRYDWDGGDCREQPVPRIGPGGQGFCTSTQADGTEQDAHETGLGGRGRENSLNSVGWAPR